MTNEEKSVSRKTLYQIAAQNSKKAIERLVVLMDSPNENVAMGACKVLLNKVLPDLKAEEELGRDEVKVVIEDYTK